MTYCIGAIKYFAREPKSLECFELFLFKLPLINEILSALKILFDATTELQNASFTLSDFYGSWLAIERRLKTLEAAPNQITGFAQALHKSIDERKSSLLNNHSLICSVYLDKRFSFKLSYNEIEIARIALQKLFVRVENGKMKSSETPAYTQNADQDSFEEECARNGLSRVSMFEEDEQAVEQCERFKRKLQAYEAIERQHNKSSLSDFWDEHKNALPEMYELASLIHSIPPTQNTVERSFSILGYIYDCRRTKLSPELLQNILIINLNRDFVDQINDRDKKNTIDEAS